MAVCVLSLLVNVGNAQIGFHENKGQFDSPISFRANFGSHVLFLDKEGFSILIHDEPVWASVVTQLHRDHTRAHSDTATLPDALALQHIKYELVGADLSQFFGTDKQTAYYNYFLGNDPARWAGEVHSFSKVLYKNIYPHIDLEYECIDRRFKYNFILNKGADLNNIRIKVVGADSFNVAQDRITTYTRFGEFSEVMPLSYEEIDGERTQINMTYERYENLIGFKTRVFKSKVKTVIDPELIFSTYSGSTADNFGFTATFDLDGALYSGGIVTSPTTVANGKYPATPGAFDETFNGGDQPNIIRPNVTPWDIAISKYSADGSTLLYATYLGGDRNEYPHSLVVNKNKELVVFGTSESSNYPTTAGAFSSLINGGVDMVVTKFSANGASLVGSTFVGGAANDGLNSHEDMNSYTADEYRGEVNLDQNENILVASSTYSVNFPITVGAYQTTSNGGQEGVAFSLNEDLSSMRWSTYFGGSNAEALYGIDLMPDGNILISGGTTSHNLPTHSGAYQENYQGGTVDGFAAILNNIGTDLVACTYFGTPQYDQVLASESDQYNAVYLAGHSTGNIPINGDVYSNANGRQFIAKLTKDLNSLSVSTVYGSGRAFTDLTINALLVDNCDRVYISGWGTNFDETGNLRLRNMPLTPDAYQSSTDGQDFHIMVLEENMSDLLYATYFGGSKTNDHVDGGTSRFDKRGAIYQSVCSSCPSGNDQQISDFPTTAGAYSPTNPSPRCSNASFKIQVVPRNEKPVLENQLFAASVLAPLLFDFEVIDPENDSLFVDYAIDTQLRSYMTTSRVADTAIARSIVDFGFSFDCASAGDTFVIEVAARDVGCPFSEQNTATITIVVDTVPILPPPDVLCLNFGRADELTINWQAIPQSAYFNKMFLYKIDPSGNETKLHEISNTGDGSYTDFDVLNPRENNYTYYLVVENICNKLGAQTYKLASVKESEVPVQSTYISTATVVEDSVRIDFERSEEDDFLSYEIYRKHRGDKAYSYFNSVFDIAQTSFIDQDVLVDEISYCYRIKVLDDCGRVSPYSNEACSMVLRGESIDEKGTTPRYRMDLNWDNYLDWPLGVASYELERAVDTGLLSPIVQLNSPSLSYTDGQLNYDWGGYWYRVVAFENPSKYNAKSTSNDIYLIQPPAVYVPNAVTANGDNLNDKFGWADVFVKEFEMKLFNRWGEKVFETTNKNDKWDGTYKTNEAMYSNVYFWIVTFTGWDGLRYTEKGTVTILK